VARSPGGDTPIAEAELAAGNARKAAAEADRARVSSLIPDLTDANNSTMTQDAADPVLMGGLVPHTLQSAIQKVYEKPRTTADDTHRGHKKRQLRKSLAAWLNSTRRVWQDDIRPVPQGSTTTGVKDLEHGGEPRHGRRRQSEGHQLARRDLPRRRRRSATA
jgi:hypothetical protein